MFPILLTLPENTQSHNIQRSEDPQATGNAIHNRKCDEAPHNPINWRGKLGIEEYMLQQPLIFARKFAH